MVNGSIRLGGSAPHWRARSNHITIINADNRRCHTGVQRPSHCANVNMQRIRRAFVQYFCLAMTGWPNAINYRSTPTGHQRHHHQRDYLNFDCHDDRVDYDANDDDDDDVVHRHHFRYHPIGLIAIDAVVVVRSHSIAIVLCYCCCHYCA